MEYYSPPLVVDVICSTKLDFLIIDSEHGVVSFETAQTAAMVCDSRGVSPIFRVGGVIEDQILRALDIGMHGIQVPNIRSADEMKKLVELAKNTLHWATAVFHLTRVQGNSTKKIRQSLQL